KTDATRVIYDRALEQFMAWSKIKSHDRLAKLKRKDAESKIISYIRYLKEQKRAPMTVRMKVAPLKHFFVMNDVVLNWEKIMKFVGGAKIVTQDRIYTKQEIQKILEKCDERKRVMFLLLVSSGIRIGALPGIRIKHLYKWQNEGIYQIIVYGDEPDASYTTFCTVECAMAIESYLDYRRKRGEEIKPDTPLIREQFHPRDANKPKPITLNGIMSILSRTLEDSGVRQHSKEANKRKEVMR